jgi:uncharacterized membrane protein
MLDRPLIALVFAAAIGSGVVGGIFYGFSSFIMGALGRLPAEQGAAAMRSINIVVLNPAFLAFFMGTALVCLVLAGGSLFWFDGLKGKLILAAALSYGVGCFGVTMFGNVPLNNQLAAGDVAQAATLWPRYLEVWTQWNHLRTLASVLASALFIGALMTP